MLKLKLTRVHFLKIFLLLCLPILTQLSCNTTEPTDELKPGRRDYIWTVDTLFLQFTPFTSITGTSPLDLWICSPGDADKIFYHFDGESWKTDLISRPVSPKSISSISNNNVWSSGRAGMIWRYDGSLWSQNYQYNVNGNTDITFESILTLSTYKILTAGQYFENENYWGIILSYNGLIWSTLNLPKIRTAFVDIKLSNNDKIYLWGVTNEQLGESRYQFYELSGNLIKEVYNGSQNSNAEYGSLLQLGPKTYFIIGYDFFSYDGNDFIKLGRLTTDPKFRNLGIGRNKKDIFLFMTDGIMHYNGEDAVYLYQTIDKSFVSKGILFEEEVYFLAYDVNKSLNLIIRGKLEE